MPKICLSNFYTYLVGLAIAHKVWPEFFDGLHCTTGAHLKITSFGMVTASFLVAGVFGVRAESPTFYINLKYLLLFWQMTRIDHITFVLLTTARSLRIIFDSDAMWFRKLVRQKRSRIFAEKLSRLE